MDFTINKYKELLESLQSAGFFFQTFSESLQNKIDKAIVLRHDVDLLPQNSLRFARIQADFGIKGSYYFRAIPESWDEKIIKEISELGHEIGYHYETMDQVSSKFNPDIYRDQGLKFYKEELIDKAFELFCENLEKLRELVPVSTICMHGSPRSKYDNKDLWNKYDYRNLDLIGEPYYDVNFDEVFYLTDTGRRWDGWKVSIRDKVSQQEEWVKQGLVFHSTNDILKATSLDNFPNKIMFTFHPQRWHDKAFPWLKELILQNAKNQVKWFLIKR